MLVGYVLLHSTHAGLHPLSEVVQEFLKVSHRDSDAGTGAAAIALRRNDHHVRHHRISGGQFRKPQQVPVGYGAGGVRAFNRNLEILGNHINVTQVRQRALQRDTLLLLVRSDGFFYLGPDLIFDLVGHHDWPALGNRPCGSSRVASFLGRQLGVGSGAIGIGESLLGTGVSPGVD